MEGSIPSLAPCMQEITERYTPNMSMPVNYKHAFDSKQNSSPSRGEVVDEPQLNVPSCNDCTLTQRVMDGAIIKRRIALLFLTNAHLKIQSVLVTKPAY